MMRLLLAGIFLVVLTAHAQQPTPDEVRRLGARADAASLEGFLAAGDTLRLHQFAYGFTSGDVPFNPRLEAAIARHLSDPRLQPELLLMILKGRGQYATPPLQAALLGALDTAVANEKRPDRVEYVQTNPAERIQRVMLALLRTQLGSEQALLERIERLPRALAPDPYMGLSDPPGTFRQSAQGMALEHLVQRKYGPAVPYLSQRLLALPADGGPQRGEAERLLSALARIDSAATARVASERFERLAAMPYQPAMQNEMVSLFAYLHRNGVQFSNARIAALLRDKLADDAFAVRLTETLARRPERQAIDSVLARLEVVAPQSPRSTRELEASLEVFEKLPDQGLLDYARLRRALPQQMSDGAATAHFRLAERGRDPQAVADMVGYVGRQVGPGGEGPLRLVLDAGTPALWREARERIETLQQEKKIEPWRYAQAKAQLDRAIADPQAQAAASRARTQAKSFEDDDNKLSAFRIQANSARGSAAWPQKMEALLAAAEPVAQKHAGLVGASQLRSQIRSWYQELGTHARFVGKDPAKAIKLYENAARYDDSPQAKGSIEDLLIADTYQFDMRSAPQALQRYEVAAAKFVAAEKSEESAMKTMAGLWSAWLKHEIAFLRTGRTFGGPLNRQEATFPLVLAMFVFNGGPFGAPAAVAELDGLPPSRISLMRAMSAISTLSEREVLRHLGRHDPSGYSSACILGLVPFFDQAMKGPDAARASSEMAGMLPAVTRPNSGFRSASARFLAERKVVVNLE